MRQRKIETMRAERHGLGLDRCRALESLVEHGLFGKPMSAFPDHGLETPVRWNEACPQQ
jgi:hypothetical protein